MKPDEVTSYVINRLWNLRNIPENDFKNRAEELLWLYAKNAREESFSFVRKRCDECEARIAQAPLGIAVLVHEECR